MIQPQSAACVLCASFGKLVWHLEFMSPVPRVIILGAGPAGLAAAYCLKQRGVSATVLERGNTVAAALRRADPETRLLSPARHSLLPGMVRDWYADEYPTFAELIRILERYRTQFAIDITTGVDIGQITHEGSEFHVQGCVAEEAPFTIAASHLILATGVISSPVLPDDFDPTHCTIPWKHSLDVRADDLRTARRLLVVGGGSSAGEVLERWLDVRPAESTVWLSLRSPLRTYVNPFFGIEWHDIASIPERLPASLFGWRAGRLREPMNVRTLKPPLRGGLIQRVGPVTQYASDHVVIGGTHIEPDLMVFATGYRAAMPQMDGLIQYDPDGRPIVKNCGVPPTPGLYWLGYRYGRNFASPYIRGIARDAEYIARMIIGESRFSLREKLDRKH